MCVVFYFQKKRKFIFHHALYMDGSPYTLLNHFPSLDRANFEKAVAMLLCILKCEYEMLPTRLQPNSPL